MKKSTYATVLIAALLSCKQRAGDQDLRGDGYQGDRDQSEEVAAAIDRMTRPFSFNVTHLTDATFKDKSRYSKNYGEKAGPLIYNFLRNTLAANWDKFPLIRRPEGDDRGAKITYFLKGTFLKEVQDKAGQPLPAESLGTVTWRLDSEYAPELVKTILIMATTPVAGDEALKNFFMVHPFYNFSSPQAAFPSVGTVEGHTPLFVDGQNNPGKPYKERPTAESTHSPLVPGSAQVLKSAIEEFYRRNHDYPLGSLMAASYNESLIGEEESAVSQMPTDQQTPPAEGGPLVSSLGLRRLIATRLMINASPDITTTELWSGKQRPVVYGYCTANCRLVTTIAKQLEVPILDLKAKPPRIYIETFEVSKSEEPLVFTRRFLPDLPRSNQGGAVPR